MGIVFIVAKAAVIAGLKKPPPARVEMFPRNAYKNPKDNDTLKTVGAVSSCGQLKVEPHPKKTRKIAQTNSTKQGTKAAKASLQCPMILRAVLWGKNSVEHHGFAITSSVFRV